MNAVKSRVFHIHKLYLNLENQLKNSKRKRPSIEGYYRTEETEFTSFPVYISCL
jgi:hypothetical protein